MPSFVVSLSCQKLPLCEVTCLAAPICDHGGLKTRHGLAIHPFASPLIECHTIYFDIEHLLPPPHCNGIVCHAEFESTHDGITDICFHTMALHLEKWMLNAQPFPMVQCSMELMLTGVIMVALGNLVFNFVDDMDIFSMVTLPWSMESS